MSTTIKVRALQDRDMFELPNGSVYEMAQRGADGEPVQAVLWCAHPPDPPTEKPALTEFHPEQSVSVLSYAESRLHVSHPGYVRAVAEHEMNRRHQERMSKVYENIKREDAAARQRKSARRPWWRNVFR